MYPMAKNVTIKDIPASEEILFANVVPYKDHSLIGIPDYKSVKFVVTNTSIYIKIAGVLIDTSGTLSLPIDRIDTLTIKIPLLKTNRFLIIGTKGYKPAQFTLTVQDCQTVVNILKNIKPSIVVEES